MAIDKKLQICQNGSREPVPGSIMGFSDPLNPNFAPSGPNSGENRLKRAREDFQKSKQNLANFLDLQPTPSFSQGQIGRRPPARGEVPRQVVPSPGALLGAAGGESEVKNLAGVVAGGEGDEFG